MLDPQLPSLTPRTIVDVPQLRRELREIRQRGHSVSTGERSAGIGAIAVPVFGAEAGCIASIGICYPESLVRPGDFESYAGILHQAAGVLSLRLGCESYPFAAKQVDEFKRLGSPTQA